MKKPAVKCAAIFLIFIILMAVIVAVMVRKIKNAAKKTKKLLPGSKGTGKGKKKAMETLCQSSNGSHNCLNALASLAGGAGDPKALTKLAFQAAAKHLREAIAASALLQQAAEDPALSRAYQTCRQFLGRSIDDLQKSSDGLQSLSGHKADENASLAYLQKWLTAALTGQQTCLRGFHNLSGDAGPKMQALLKTPTELTVSGLAMIADLRSVLP